MSDLDYSFWQANIFNWKMGQAQVRMFWYSVRLFNILCSCSLTHLLIGQAIASQQLRENCLLSMILKPNRSMRAVFNAHSVVQMWYSKGKAITISQTGMNTKRNAPSEIIPPAPYKLLCWLWSWEIFVQSTEWKCQFSCFSPVFAVPFICFHRKYAHRSRIRSFG